MGQIVVQPNQSMFDVIIQGCGSIEAGIQFCQDNGVSVSDTPTPGTVYVVNAAAAALGDNGVSLYLRQNGIVVGTLGGDGGLAPVVVFSDESGSEVFESEDGGEVFEME